MASEKQAMSANELMTFDQALIAMRQGKKVRRRGTYTYRLYKGVVQHHAPYSKAASRWFDVNLFGTDDILATDWQLCE